MKIKSLKLKNFKRFTDLSIEEIPIDTKLVLLIGENGSGKSSIFDAFEYLSGPVKKRDYPGSEYYKKELNKPINIKVQLKDAKFIEVDERKYLSGQSSALNFYGRSSLRIVPQITNINVNKIDVKRDTDGPLKYTDYDNRFLYDVIKFTQNINAALREPIFAGTSANTVQIFQEYIAPLNNSLVNIFGDSDQAVIKLVQYEDGSIANPPRLIFQKGNAKINFDLLSHGEKQVVTILLNFIVRKRLFNNIIFFIDEMDAHMNTSLQYNLIKEITENWIPENCQLWTASHSLGFIEYAKQYEYGQIIDFDQLNFDLPQTLKPISKESLEIYEVAVPKSLVLEIFKNKRIIVCERNDSEYYNLALGGVETIFIPVNNSREVLLTVKSTPNFLGLRDRDFLKINEIQALKSKIPNLKILDFYSFESYLYHPHNIGALGLDDFDIDLYKEEIRRQKNQRLVEIASRVIKARQSYEEFKLDLQGYKKEDVQEILDALKSDEFDTFFPYYNLRDNFSRDYLAHFNLRKEQLVGTNWFKEQIRIILE